MNNRLDSITRTTRIYRKIFVRIYVKIMSNNICLSIGTITRVPKHEI